MGGVGVGGGSLATSGYSKDGGKDGSGGKGKAPTKAGLKALDLAVTRVREEIARSETDGILVFNLGLVAFCARKTVIYVGKYIAQFFGGARDNLLWCGTVRCGAVRLLLTVPLLTVPLLMRCGA